MRVPVPRIVPVPPGGVMSKCAYLGTFIRRFRDGERVPHTARYLSSMMEGNTMWHYFLVEEGEA